MKDTVLTQLFPQKPNGSSPEKRLKKNKWRVFFWKIGMGLVGLLIIHYPNPILLLKNIRHLLNPESLIQPNAPFLIQVNQEIDQGLPPNTTPSQEFKWIQQYVYQKIPYEFDWNLWGNIDYWPTTQEVWNLKKEDCDGQAILTVSILRSRGFTSARIVGNLKHVWVQVDQKELMGPGEEKNFQGKRGQLFVSLPSFYLLMGSLSFYLREFPQKRILLLWFLILVLLFYPACSRVALLQLLPFNLSGFLFLQYWAQTEKGITLIFLSGWCFTLFSWRLAYTQSKRYSNF